ncbi:MAG: hypothetical protein H8E66_14855 [Planctomycetes bacterium]|nr:hypothetical protein [Planctomycetota bacterium]
MTEVLKALPGIFLTVLCWGAYGSVLHKGQHLLNENRLKPLICVGVAYLVIAVILPVVLLTMQGKLSGDWSFGGVSWSLAAGAAGAFGALGIILALTSGGKPTYVMPMVFGCAPIVNVVVSMWFANIPLKNLSPAFISGLMLVSVGAVMVLVFKPSPPKKPTAATANAVQPAETEEHETSAGETADEPEQPAE